MTVHQPDIVILDLGSAISEYKDEVAGLAHVLETNHDEMLSWLSCYVSTRDWAHNQIDAAVGDILGCVSCDENVPTVALEKFSDAALGLGLSMVKKLEEAGLFSSESGAFPYAYTGLFGKSALFRRTGSIDDDEA